MSWLRGTSPFPKDTYYLEAVGLITETEDGTEKKEIRESGEKEGIHANKRYTVAKH